MSRQTPSQKATVERVMHAFKTGELRSRGTGPRVTDPRQAIAIALHEAGASTSDDETHNRKSLARTQAKERKGETAQVTPDPSPARPQTPAEDPQPAEPVGIPPSGPDESPGPSGEPLGIPPSSPVEIPVTPSGPQPTA